MLSLPPNISFLYNRASKDQLDKINQTCDHFGIKNNKTIAETLLRMKKHLSETNLCIVPKDQSSKTLIQIYKHFESLSR